MGIRVNILSSNFLEVIQRNQLSIRTPPSSSELFRQSPSSELPPTEQGSMNKDSD
ncbi:unnamed protein product [Malus baccata var. baccata]